MGWLRLYCVALVCAVGWGVGGHAESPSVLYLTWIHDPSTTMTISWHSPDSQRGTEVHYRQVGEEAWQKKGGAYTRLAMTDILIHHVELIDLLAGGEYEFRVNDKTGIYRFRTLPLELDRPVRFVVGGDAYLYLNLLRRMNYQIAAQSPDFVVVGGDIAYTHGRSNPFRLRGWQVRRWRAFLKAWKEQMVTKEGRLIPILPVLGNHDVGSSGLNPFSNRLMFYDLFALPEKGTGYRVFDCGNYLSLLLLDTGHTYYIGGQQAFWLKQTLAERENVSYKMAAYHVAGYPSVYPYEGVVPQEIRKQWSPIFERYHLNAAFEHHNHAYKRTYPIKAGQIDENGVVYLGDGSWGVSPRKPKNADLWYLAKTKRANAVCVITLDRVGGTIQALTNKGKIIDEVMTRPGNSLVAIDEKRLLID